MFEEMKQFLSSAVCLSCQGCCRFDKEKSDWRPKVGASEERSIIAALAPAQKIKSRTLVEKGGYLADQLCHGMYLCTFFNPDDSTCGIYHNRPFECRFYPFVLTKSKQSFHVSVHLPCPYIKEKKGSVEYDNYVDYIKGYLERPEVKTLLKENPHLFGEYRGYESELESVFEVKV